MTRKELIKFCLNFPSVYEDYPFDTVINEHAWTVMRQKDNKKAFAFIFERGGELLVNLKCDPDEAVFFRGQYEGITPAYHMNKTHWNTVKVNGDVPIDLLQVLIKNSYELTKPKKK